MLSVAIAWGQKESAYWSSPLLPALGQKLPSDLASLSDYVSAIHKNFGTEVSYYWCFPFWALASSLVGQDIQIAGLDDYELSGLQPDLIVLVDLPVQRQDYTSLTAKYPDIPTVLIVAETPLERHAQHYPVNLSHFSAVISYGKSSWSSSKTRHLQYNLPFRFYRPPNLNTSRLRSPSERKYLCAYVGNSHSSGWKRNYQYQLAWKGWPVIWQFLQGWKIPYHAALSDENYGAYGVRISSVLAAQSVFRERFYLNGSGWSSGGSGWFNKLFPDSRLKLHTHQLGMQPGSKISLLCNSVFTLTCENYLGESGYISEKVFDSMSAGSIPVYIGAKNSLPAHLRDLIIDLSHLPKKVLRSPSEMSNILFELLDISDSELLQKQQMCLDYIDNIYEDEFGINQFVDIFSRAILL